MTTSTSTSQATGSSSKPASTSQAAKVSTVDPNAEYTIYTVQSGDSLYQIAKKFPGVSSQNIMDFNGIGSNIKPGMKIKIPKI